MKPYPIPAAPKRTVDWTKERIALLATPELKQLRANAERLNDTEVMGRCDDVLKERKRTGPRKKKVPAAAPVSEVA